jgi:photosystem II stability/assembly factor-like uncharacterized protein
MRLHRALVVAADAALVGAIPAIVLVAVVAGTRASERATPSAAPTSPLVQEALEHTHGDEALAFRNLQKQDENGVIPRDGLLRADAHVARMKQAQRAQAARAAGTPKGSSAADVETVAGIDRASWEWLGPGNIGGRIRSIVIHPTDPDTMWVGSVTGGIFKSTNGGASWTHLDDFMSNLAVSTLVAHPSAPGTLYAGTGESFTYNVVGAGNRGAGVFKSTDGGATWAQLPSTAGSVFDFVNRLAVHPVDPQILLAALEDGIMRSEDAGASWTLVYQSASHLDELKDVDFDPVDGNKAVASGENGLALYSVDGGVTWEAATGIPGGIGSGSGRLEVAYAAGNPAVVYASLDHPPASELYRSEDGGHSYTLVHSATDYLASQGWYDNALWVSPVDDAHVIVGGVDLYRSTDSGATLTKISDWTRNYFFVRGEAPTNSAHADHHVIVSHPGYDGATNKTVFFGNDGGIAKTLDVLAVAPTTGWQELNNNLGITQFYGAAANPATDTIIGGTQDNGTLRYTPAGGTEGWHMTFGGDGGFNSSDPTDSNYYYGEYIYLQIHRSTDGAQNSQFIVGCGNPPPLRLTDACTKNANFIAPFLLDPNEPTRLLAGGRSLWRTNDARTEYPDAFGPTWEAIKGPNGVAPAPGANISAIAVAEGNSDLVYVGHNDGEIYRTTNGTAAAPTWTKVNHDWMPHTMVLDLTIDPVNHDVVYAAYGGFLGFQGANVWRSENGGATWWERAGFGATGLPTMPVRSIAVNAENTSWIYAGTELGVFASEDAGVTWHVPNDGPANVPVDELVWMDHRLVAATHGRGVFRSEPLGPPANDDFSRARPLGGPTVLGTNVGAGREPGEPHHAGDDGGASVWYKWTAPADGTLELHTGDSDFDTLLAVYTGSEPGSLVLPGPEWANDDESSEVVTSRIGPVPVTEGTTYRIAVDGFSDADGTGPATGTVRLARTFLQSRPGPPRGVSAKPGDRHVRLSWFPPRDPGISPITNYVITPFVGATPQPATEIPAFLTHTLRGLENGTTYTFRVAARTAQGVGQQSAASNPVTPRRPAVADFDGDGASEIGVFRPSSGLWALEGLPWTQFGIDGDVPVPADQEGDGDDDIAVWRPSTGLWARNGGLWEQFGIEGDIPVPADYNLDRADIGVFRPSTGLWAVRGMSWTHFGINGDIPVPADYNGDGRADIAVWRPSTGLWAIRGQEWAQFGIEGDIPVPADYDGDGDADIAVWRPSTGLWAIRGQDWAQFGIPGDIPIPADYDGDERADIAVWRPSTGLWAINGLSWAQFGAEGDIPVTLPPALALHLGLT